MNTKYINIWTELVTQSHDPLSSVSGGSGRFCLFDEFAQVVATVLVGSDAVYCKEAQELYKGEDNFIRFLSWLEGVMTTTDKVA